MQTLNDFFNTHRNSMDWANNLTSLEEFSQAKPLIARELSTVELPPEFYERLILKLCDALDLKIGNLLVAGYRKHRDIVAYRDKEDPPEGFHTVPLLEHTLTSTHAPTIQPVINQMPLATLKFDISLSLNLKAGKLYIRDGEIIRAETGEVFGSGSIGFEGIKILEKQTAAYDLPGLIPFDPPIEI